MRFVVRHTVAQALVDFRLASRAWGAAWQPRGACQNGVVQRTERVVMVGINAAGAMSVKRDKRSLSVGVRCGACNQSSQDTQTASTYYKAVMHGI